MRARPCSREHGFTLVEVLVALVITGILLTIILQAEAGAQQRQRGADDRMRATLVADAVLAEAIARPFQEGRTEGTASGLTWTLDESVLARDPRGFFFLSQLMLDVRNHAGRTLIALEARKLKPASRS